MKRQLVASGLALVLLLAVSTFEFAKAQSGMAKQDDMAMQMKMMANRPKSMKNADMAIQQVKKAAAKKGMYGCCLKHPCDLCGLKMGACGCGSAAAMHKAVCNECKGGWAVGDGAIPGLHESDIKTMPRMGMGM